MDAKRPAYGSLYNALSRSRIHQMECGADLSVLLTYVVLNSVTMIAIKSGRLSWLHSCPESNYLKPKFPLRNKPP